MDNLARAADETRYRLWLVTVYPVRVVWEWTAWAAESAGYWIRPYDMITDARRWRWQPRAKCGSQVFAELPDTDRLELINIAEHIRRREVEPDG
jgi:hypothetical protein